MTAPITRDSMTIPLPDRDVPLREIPALIRDLRGRLAQEYTRAEAAERKLKRMGDMTTIDQLTDHCAAQGRYIAKLDDELKALRYFVRVVWDEFETSGEINLEALRDGLHDLVVDHGATCETCLGECEVRQTRFNGYEDKWTGAMMACPDCHLGKVPN